MSPSPYFTIPFLLIVAILQSTAAPRLIVAGVRPDLMFVFVTAWTMLAAFRARELQYVDEPPTLWRGINDGVVWAFTGGIFLDLLSGAPLGTSALALMLAAMAAGIFGVGIAAAAPILMIIIVPIGTFIYHLIFLTEVALAGRPAFWSYAVTKVILPSVVFNLALFPVAYLLLSPLSRRTERERLQW